MLTAENAERAWMFAEVFSDQTARQRRGCAPAGQRLPCGKEPWWVSAFSVASAVNHIYRGSYSAY